MKTQFAAALLATALAVAPGFVSAQDDNLEHLVIQMASTPAEHSALSRHYLANAEQARQDVRRHERMAQAYERQPGPMRGHCQRLAVKYGEIAAEYEQLAKLHEAESKKAQ